MPSDPLAVVDVNPRPMTDTLDSLTNGAEKLSYFPVSPQPPARKDHFFAKKDMIFPCPFFGASFFDLVDVETGAFAFGAGGGSSSEKDSQACSCFVTGVLG